MALEEPGVLPRPPEAAHPEVTSGAPDPGIPSLAEHEREIRRLWRLCIVLASGVFVGALAVVLALVAAQHQLAALLAISTIGFQVLVMSYGAGFFVPAFVTSLKKLGLGIRLSYRGLELAQETAHTVRELREDLGPVVADLKYIAERARPVVDTLHRLVVQERLLERISEDMKAIRARVERDTEPLPVRRRGDGRGDVSED